MAKLQVQYDFLEGSRYAALKAGSNQISAIDSFNRSFGEAIYYLFYNPRQIPSSTKYPVTEYTRWEEAAVGCRVHPAKTVDPALALLKDGVSPTYAELSQSAGDDDMRLESWIVDLLKCNAGQPFDETREVMVANLLERRSGPIGAAIAISIALPTAG